jgi:hypothetical protein
MSALLLNDAAVISALIAVPSFGAWWADLRVDIEQDLTGSVTFTDGVASFTGTVFRSGVFQGAAELRVVGGAGGFAPTAATLAAKAYRNVPLNTVLADVMSASGETLTEDSDDPTLANFVAHWHRTQASAGTELSRITDHVNLGWRVKPSGEVFVGPLTFPDVEIEAEVISTDNVRGTELIAPQSFDLEPAVSFNGRPVSRVHHILEPGTRRSEIWFADEVAA